MKKYSRMIGVILLAAMMLTAFVGCQKTGDTDDTSTTADSTSESATEATEETPDLPENLDYDGYEFLILVTGNYASNDFTVVEGVTDVVNEAIFKKNMATEQTLGVKITNEDKSAFGSTRGAGPGYTAFRQSYMSNSEEYSMGVIGAYDCATMAYNALLSDLKTIDNLDLSHSWWDPNAERDMTIKDKLFFTAGDMSLTAKKVTHCILFSKEIIRENPTLRNPYELVREDNWNFDTFGEEIKKVSEDVNGDNKFDMSDKFGLLTWNDPIMAILTASGERIVTLKDNGTMTLTLYTERADAVLQKYCDILYDREHAVNYQYNAPSAEWDPSRERMFNENRALYYMNVFVTVGRHRDKETDFGILPYPKAEKTRSVTTTPIHPSQPPSSVFP